MLKIKRVRQVATLLMLSSAVWLGFSPSPVHAQSSQTQSTTDDAVDTVVSKEQAEFDELIIGPWVKLAKVSDALPKPSAITSSLKRCFTPPKISGLKVEPGAERKLPDPTNLAGDMVYYRTKKGLQRFDFTQGFLVLLTELRKNKVEGRSATWAIRGTNLRFLIRFANAKKQGGSGQFMIENDNVYLRCPRPDKDKKTTDQ